MALSHRLVAFAFGGVIALAHIGTQAQGLKAERPKGSPPPTPKSLSPDDMSIEQLITRIERIRAEEAKLGATLSKMLEYLRLDVPIPGKMTIEQVFARLEDGRAEAAPLRNGLIRKLQGLRKRLGQIDIDLATMA